MRTVSPMAANPDFSREGEHGRGIPITRHGWPVAPLVPHGAEKAADLKWAAAHQRMVARLEDGASLGGLRVERAELHD